MTALTSSSLRQFKELSVQAQTLLLIYASAAWARYYADIPRPTMLLRELENFWCSQQLSADTLSDPHRMTLLLEKHFESYLATPERERPLGIERPKKSKAKPMYTVDDHATLIRHKGRVLKAMKHWIAEERMVLNQIEYVLHEAGRQLLQGRELVKRLPIPIKRPEELLLPTRPDTSKWGDFIPNPDYWAEWLARWLAVCLPAQEDLQIEVLRETSLWARSG